MLHQIKRIRGTKLPPQHETQFLSKIGALKYKHRNRQEIIIFIFVTIQIGSAYCIKPVL